MVLKEYLNSMSAETIHGFMPIDFKGTTIGVYNIEEDIPTFYTKYNNLVRELFDYISVVPYGVVSGEKINDK